MDKKYQIIISVVVIFSLISIVMFSIISNKKETEITSTKVDEMSTKLKSEKSTNDIKLKFITNHLPKELGMVDLKIGENVESENPQLAPIVLLQMGLLNSDADAFTSAFSIDSLEKLLNGKDLVTDKEAAIQEAIGSLSKNNQLKDISTRRIDDRKYYIQFYYLDKTSYKTTVLLTKNDNVGVDTSYRIDTSIVMLLENMSMSVK